MDRMHGARMALGLMSAIAMTAAAPIAAAPAAPAAPGAKTTLVTADGKSVGQVTLTQAADGLLVKASITGMKPGSYGFHLHTVGKCDKPEFTTAGGHWNPTEHKHGKDNPAGPHMGDLMNVEVAASGMATFEQKIPGAMLQGGDHPLLDADGAAVVLHAGPDDYKTDPSGNSGPRIACGVLDLSK